ncbi:MAG: hypothetical protein ACTSYR_02350 [Candidatus Odinarchaeia archaeon]
MLGHLKVSLMKRKKDVYGLLHFLSEVIDKNDADSGRAVIALVKLGRVSVKPICEFILKTDNNFLIFTLIRVLYSIADPSCKETLITLVKRYLSKYLTKSYSSKNEPADEKAVYFIAVKTLKHLNYPPEKWGISSEQYYDKVREDYEKSES